MRKIIIALTMLLFTTTALSASFVKLSPHDKVNLPKDMYYKKNFASQWWYLTGHLETEDGRKFGYELTFFAVGVNNNEYKSNFGLNNLYISHFAVSDIKNGNYYQSDEISRGAFNAAGAASDKLYVQVYDTFIKGNLKNMQLEAAAVDFSLKLDLTSSKQPVLNGDRGYSNKVYGCKECASLYFSITNIDSKGQISIKDKQYAVSGKSWFDREINSDYNNSKVAGWDWFSIMLDDGRELMIYRIRDSKNNINKSSYSVIIDKNGRKKIIDFDSISFEKLSFYRSKATKSNYPVAWRIKIPGKNIDIRVEPFFKNQEFLAGSTTFNNYWEGACSVSGSHTGKAYIELTGY